MPVTDYNGQLILGVNKMDVAWGKYCVVNTYCDGHTALVLHFTSLNGITVRHSVAGICFQLLAHSGACLQFITRARGDRVKVSAPLFYFSCRDWVYA